MFLEEKSQGEVRQAPVQVGTLRLSTAIRIGAKKRGQCIGLLQNDLTCAIGAAYEGAFGKLPSTLRGTSGAVSDLRKAGIWPKFLDSSEIFSKNDNLGWTREQIADWLEKQGY